MKKAAIWIALTCLIVISLVLASCNSATTTTNTQTTTNTSTNTQTTTNTTSTTSKMSSTTTAPPTSATTSTGNWWDSTNKPQYGGEIVLRIATNIATFDPYYGYGMNIECLWMERLFMPNWTTNPAEFNFKTQWFPFNYMTGQLAESWEFTDPSTFVFHIRQGVHWQDISPANGREFTADDVVFSYSRQMIIAGSKGSPTSDPKKFSSVVSMTATEKYTVVFKFTTTNPEIISELLLIGTNDQLITNPDAVKLWGDVNDWRRAIGTGPFILRDFVSGSSATLVKNLNYWGYDERYPQNQLPYAERVKVLIIPDNATVMAAMRTGKIDAVDGISLDDAQIIRKTNPELLFFTYPSSNSSSLDPRNDKAPFTDIRVRKAMQLALDLSTIANSYYGGTADPRPLESCSYSLTGWTWPYEQWPQDLKDEYAYNPTAAKKLLADAGYPTGFKTNVVADASGDLNLLQVVKSYFAAVGIDMEIRPMDRASWTQFVGTSKKHDQMSYRNGALLAHSFEPTMQFTFRSGNSGNYPAVSDPAYDALYSQFLAAPTSDAMKQIMIATNEYVVRQHFVISLLEKTNFSFAQPWLNGYSGQVSTITGGSSGPVWGSFITRFWIDQNLKKSLGH